MRFKVEIDVMPLDALLDPQGKAVTQSMKTIGLAEISNVRVGRHIELFVEAVDQTTATAKIEAACKGLLVNQVMEKYTYTIEEVEEVEKV